MAKRAPARGVRIFSGPVDHAVRADFAAACRQQSLPANANPAALVLTSPEETWREAVAGQWVIAYRLALKRGALVISEIRIYPDEAKHGRPGRRAGEWSAAVLGNDADVPAGGVPSDVHRRISAKGVLRGVLGKLTAWRQELDALYAGAKGQRTGLVETLSAGAERRRRAPRVTDKELERVVRAYKQAAMRDPKQPSLGAARSLKMDSPDGRARVRYLVHLARRRPGFSVPPWRD